MKLTESERGEAFEAMRRRHAERDMLRLDDHAPLDFGQATSGDDVLMGIFAAVGAGVLAPFVVMAVIYAARVVGSVG